MVSVPKLFNFWSVWLYFGFLLHLDGASLGNSRTTREQIPRKFDSQVVPISRPAPDLLLQFISAGKQQTSSVATPLKTLRSTTLDSPRELFKSRVLASCEQRDSKAALCSDGCIDFCCVHNKNILCSFSNASLDLPSIPREGFQYPPSDQSAFRHRFLKSNELPQPPFLVQRNVPSISGFRTQGALPTFSKRAIFFLPLLNINPSPLVNPMPAVPLCLQSTLLSELSAAFLASKYLVRGSAGVVE